ncbi:Pre-rRNA-processing protein fhl1 [Marasmius tenuissimus]|uniref:Pre-rRNA-processing protein fhl1 n=1 Tax=Marasmius tenuissimus TaxID=585030 RepID=A0ABR3ABV4_9AGAR
MQTRSASRSPVPLPVIARDNDEEAQQPSKISAYYSLVFPHFTFYIQTLSVTIGRRCSPPAQPSASSSTAPADPVQVDVDLGALKSVSRLHAKIQYDQEQDRFVLQVIGRNGAWVDGVWQGSGTRAPLGERSQIQIASRIFHFVLPPPPPPEDSPSPPSEEVASDSPATATTATNATSHRARSPSLDITSMTPPESLPEPDPPEDPPVESKPPTPPPALVTPAVSGKLKSSKKRKKRESESTTVDILSPEPSQPLPQPPAAGPSGKHPKVEEPKPKLPPGEEMPPKPSLTYAQLIFRAIKALNGKATLQEICAWIAKEFDYYRYVEGNAWTSSIRHNLSSGRAFKKMERCGGDRGKGFFWSLDEAHLHTLEEQDARLLLNAASGGKKGGKDKDKALEPALKRSVKGDSKGPLPPPLTNTPLPLPTATKTLPATVVKPNGKVKQEKTSVGQTGVFAYPGTGYPTHPSSTLSSSNPYAALTQSHWGIPGKYPYGPHPPAPQQMVKSPPPAAISPQQQQTPSSSTSAAGAPSGQPSETAQPPKPTTTTAQSPPVPQLTPQPSSSTTPALAPSSDLPPSIPPALETVIVPIVISPPSAAPPKAPMLLQDSKIILDPSIFSDLTPEMLSALEKLGARQAIHVLTGHMTRVLKEREKKGKSKKKDKDGKKRDKDKSRKKDKDKDKDKERDKVKMEVDGPGVGLGASVQASGAPDATQGPPERADSPIVIIDDDEDEGPAPKRRKLTNDPATMGSSLPVVPGLQTVSAMS